jgi:hypothetical protein
MYPSQGKSLLKRNSRTLRFVAPLLILSFLLPVASPVYAATPTIDKVEEEIAAVTSSLEEGIEKVEQLQTETVTAMENTISVAVTEGLSATGVNPGVISSLSKLNPEVTKELVADAFDEAVLSGTLKLEQISRIGIAPEESIDNLVDTAINEAISKGTVSLSQIKAIDFLDENDLNALVQTSIKKAIDDGSLVLTEVSSTVHLSGQVNQMVEVAVGEAISKGVALTTLEKEQVITNAVSAITSSVGDLSVSEFQGIVASKISAYTGASVASIVNNMSGVTVEAFQSAVENAVISETVSKVSSLVGTVDLAQVQNTIVNNVMSVADIEGVISTVKIAASVKNILDDGFEEVVKDAVMSAAANKVGELIGAVDLSDIKNSISSEIISATGLGNLSTITQSLGAFTSSAFQDTLKDAFVGEAAKTLNSIAGSLDVSGIQNTIAGSFASVGGGGNIATIAASLSTIDADAITNAIKDSVVQNAIAQLGSLSTVTLANVESAIASGIMGITGTGSITAITDMVTNNLSSSISSITNISNQLEGITTNLTQQIASLTNLSDLVASNFDSALTEITSITSSLTNIEGLASSVLGSVTGSLATSIESITSLSSTIFSTGALSLANATSITNLTGIASGAISSVTTNLSSLTSSVSGLSSGVTGIGGIVGGGGGLGSLVGYPFGGRITRVQYCSCTFNYAVSFSDLTVPSKTGGLPLIYQPGMTRLYPFGRVTKSGSWMLGTFQPAGVCLRLSKRKCRLIPTAGTMSMVGTSM